MSNLKRNNEARLQEALQAIEQGAAPDDILNAMDADTRADLEPLLRLALHMEAMSHPEPPKAKNKIKRFPVKKRPNRTRQFLRLATSAATLVVLAGLLVVAYSMMTESPREQWTTEGYGSLIDVPDVATVTPPPGNMPDVFSMTATANVLMNRPSVSVPTSTPDDLMRTATERVQRVTATVQIQQTATAVAQGMGNACPLQEGWRTHRVQSRETLQSLAEMYGISVELLASANCLDETDGIQPGQIIYLPVTPLPVDPLALTVTQQILSTTATTVAQPSTDSTPLSNIINDVTVQATAQDFQNGRMVYRSDTGEIYVLIDGGDDGDGGQALTYSPAEYGDLSLPDRTPPEGFYVPRQGFGRIWSSDADLSVTLGWAVRPETGWQMRIITYENGAVDLYQPNGIMYRVQGDSWQLFP
jgi:LysM repeat protein